MLSRPANQYVLTCIRAALDFQVRPGVMLWGAMPGGRWTPFEVALAIAVRIIKEEVCPKCNNPIWLCRSNDPNLSFSVREDVCHAARALEEFQARSSGKDVSASERAKFGAVQYVVPDMFGDRDIPTRRDFFTTEVS